MRRYFASGRFEDHCLLAAIAAVVGTSWLSPPWHHLGLAIAIPAAFLALINAITFFGEGESTDGN